MKCPYCGARTELIDNTVIYGRRYGNGLAVACRNFPVCSAYVGCHQDGTPYGTLANYALRFERRKAHAAFDPLWENGMMARDDAYRWLARRLEIDKENCHIGMFDTETCKRVVEVVKSLREAMEGQTPL